MLWLCAHFPQLSLEVFTRGTDGSGCAGTASAEPLAVSEQRKRLSRVITCNHGAWLQGVRPGMAVNAAHALVRTLQVYPRNEKAEQELLRRLAAWAVQFTPVVSVAEPRDLLLEVAGSLKLFGGKEVLLQRVHEGLDSLGCRAQVAIAPTPLAAAWLAGSGRECCIADPTQLVKHILPLPLHVLELEEKPLATLTGMGLQCVGDCLRLPRDGLARRLGPELLKKLDQALGRLPDPRVPYRAPPRFSSHLLLPAEVEQVGALLFGVRRLVSELAGVLRGCNSGARELHLQLIHRRALVTRISLRLVAPGHDPRHLSGLLQERLQQTRLPEPVRELSLSSRGFVPLACRNRDWVTPDNTESEHWAVLIERLRARLGDDAVHGLYRVAEYRPERAWGLAAPDEKRAGRHDTLAKFPTGESRADDLHSGPPRPPWLLPEPVPLEMNGDNPYLDGDLTLECGRERIESGWWDGSGVARDYFIARNPRGARFWIYRQLTSARGWFLHGVFG